VAAPGRNVQPGTADNLLKGPGGGSEGIPLTSTILPVANLNTAAQTTAVQPQEQKSEPQQPNIVLLVAVAVLAVLAVLALWRAWRSEKNTTQY
jgi:hypothetical protein